MGNGALPNGPSYRAHPRLYQEVQTVMPAAVLRGSDGYLRVFYDKLGLKFQTYDQWTASGAHVPGGTPAAQSRFGKKQGRKNPLPWWHGIFDVRLRSSA